MNERLQTIPEGSIEVQTGLWAWLRTYTFNGQIRQRYNLYSSEGYCFYLPENNLDEEGNLLPENQRMYYQYMISVYTTIDEINAEVVSVPVQDGYEIANTNGPHVTE